MVAIYEFNDEMIPDLMIEDYWETSICTINQRHNSYNSEFLDCIVLIIINFNQYDNF